MAMTGMADGKSIDALDFVNEAVRQPEIYGAVNRGRLWPAQLFGQRIKDIISAQRLISASDNLQHELARIGQTMAVLCAVVFGFLNIQ